MLRGSEVGVDEGEGVGATVGVAGIVGLAVTVGGTPVGVTGNGVSVSVGAATGVISAGDAGAGVPSGARTP